MVLERKRYIYIYIEADEKTESVLGKPVFSLSLEALNAETEKYPQGLGERERGVFVGLA